MCAHVVGNEFFKQKKYEEAAAYYTEAMKKNPNDPRVRILVFTVIILHITSECNFNSLVEISIKIRRVSDK